MTKLPKVLSIEIKSLYRFHYENMARVLEAGLFTNIFEHVVFMGSVFTLDLLKINQLYIIMCNIKT